MATPLSAGTFLKALRTEGLTVVEIDGWRAHNRNHVGPWGPVHGVMIHHTATSGAARTVEVCRDGRPDLPGPLCHGVITKDGRIHVVGYGRANHAGRGDDDVLRAVVERGCRRSTRRTRTATPLLRVRVREPRGRRRSVAGGPAGRHRAGRRRRVPSARLDGPLGDRPPGVAAGEGGPAGLHDGRDAGAGGGTPQVTTRSVGPPLRGDNGRMDDARKLPAPDRSGRSGRGCRRPCRRWRTSASPRAGYGCCSSATT